MQRALPRFLAAIGRHSLQVFYLGLFLSWGSATAFRLFLAQGWLGPLLIGTGALILGAFAQGLDRRRAGRRAQPQGTAVAALHLANERDDWRRMLSEI